MTHSGFNNLVVPTKQDKRIAEMSSRQLASYLKDMDDHIVSFNINNNTLSLPESAAKLLLEILTNMAQGNSLSLLPYHKELTTQEAADLLNVSRPYLVQLLENGDIPFRKVGKKRRVLAKDIFAYKENIDNARHKTLEKLSEQAQKLNMGYESE